MSIKTAVVVVLVLIGLAVVTITLIGFLPQAHAAATPYYTTGDHTGRIVVKFDSDCWHEVYIRMTPKHNNNVLLNYVYIENNDEPDAGPSETLYVYLPFKDSKMQATKSTNENRIRGYVGIELTDLITGETVTKYIPYDKNKRVQEFPTFFMKTEPELCR